MKFIKYGTEVTFFVGHRIWTRRLSVREKERERERERKCDKYLSFRNISNSI